jgi:hypothetical protein
MRYQISLPISEMRYMVVTHELLMYRGAEMCTTKIIFTKCVFYCCCKFVFILAPVIRLLRIQYECDNLLVLTLVLFRLVLKTLVAGLRVVTADRSCTRVGFKRSVSESS